MGTTLRPIAGSPDGLGAFVRLDYNTNSEHAVVLLAKEWDSLAHFIYAPGVFIERWRAGYDDTPEHMHLKYPSKAWELEGPVTFNIEPLTVPTSSNAMKLGSLAPLYNGLKTVAQNWYSTPPEKFLNDTIGAIRALPASWDLGTLGVAGTDPFEFAYIAEFAIKTRTITIKYIPRQHERGMYKHEKLTTMTINKVILTDLNFIHFDIHIPDNIRDRHTIALERAIFAVDYLTNPAFINKVDQIDSAKSKARKSDAPFLANLSPKSLPDAEYPEKDRPNIYGEGGKDGKGPYQPRLVIDSVWPDPGNQSYGDHKDEIEEYEKKKLKKDLVLNDKFRNHSFHKTSDEGSTIPAWESEMPQLCVLLHTLQATNQDGTYINGEYITMEALIKAYTSPEPITP